ncbi:diguanylate cyclase response regulator [Enterovibrio norvegicus FF-33]|uniref:GGDEF domain-containing response regulator n=1 Tax=Enterovibrio norvegicus TaxID=188144 RepID=UPI0003094831|nr:diguanylate cyclase [Enterovibrio norvegicus]OEE68434.1 diguanylate cyclase response regulator [Enterovibrio norvegicus FF-33]OEE74301.1 diguanylate cyclase response regulator [Enterovibrio norvegicus FF-162]
MTPPLTALIADDDKATAKLVEMLLIKWGIKTVVAYDGLEALEVMMQADPPSLLLLDWEMPSYSGIELCEKIRQIDTANPPYIILCTARDSAEHIVQGLNKGANDYISKPFNTQVLKARVEVGKRTLELQSRLVDAMTRLDHLASFDELTGLLNRRVLFERIREDFSRAHRAKENLCFAVCDIDWFKRINDKYGHPAGDAILRQLGDLLTQELRPYDRLGRIGGEEFLLLFSVKDDCNAVKVLERIRSAIEHHDFVYDEKLIAVTMSFGATFIEAGAEVARVEAYFKRADEALYRSKETGRNHVTFSENIV